MNMVHGEMKVNLFFKKHTDVGAVADALLDAIPGLTAFNHATEHKATNNVELHVARSKDINIFTDFKSFITIDPLSEEGEKSAALIIAMMAVHEDFTLMDAHELVVNL